VLEGTSVEEEMNESFPFSSLNNKGDMTYWRSLFCALACKQTNSPLQTGVGHVMGGLQA
jgi:hypothetical protein